MINKFNKYDLLNIELQNGSVPYCLVSQVSKGGIHIYPIEKYIIDVEHPRAIAKIFIPYEKIVKTVAENYKKLFMAVNTEHEFIKETLEYYMTNEAKRRQN